MSDSLSPKYSVDLFVRMSHLLDFKDKVLKILGTSAKVSAIAGSRNSKDLRAFASQLSTTRRWMKFGKIMRSTPEILNPVGDVVLPKSATLADYIRLFLSKAEFVADIFQMVAEDIHTLHRSRYWSAALGLRPIKNIDLIEDRAWWIWSLFAALSSGLELRELRTRLESSTLRLAALDEITVPEEVKRMKQEVAVLKIKYYLVLFKFVKFACEVIDSSIALAPDRIKAVNPAGFELLSCLVGSLSAVSSLHKLLYNESRAS
jgi:hypothetical protein